MNNINMQIVDEIYTENDNTYVNISFTNRSSASFAVQSQLLQYNVTKTSPIIEDSSKYYVSVAKFDIPLGAIPITIFPVIPGQGNPNLSTLEIGILNNNGIYSVNLIYVNQNGNGFTAPQQTNPYQQIITEYYFVYSYTQMITMINTALNTAYGLAGLTNTAPYFIYNPTTQLISLIVGSEFNTNTGPKIFVGYDMLQYLEGFNFTALTAISNNLYSFTIYGLVNESYGYAPFGTTPSTTILFYKLTQEYEHFQGWNPIRKILFISNTLPFKSEISPSNNPTQSADGVINSIPIITDFTPIVEQPGDSRSTAYYNANGYAGLRLVDMTSTKPIYKLDVNVFWQDVNNNVYPLVINLFQSANIKLAFIRKSLYKNF